MRRTIWQQARVMWLFIITKDYNKPGTRHIYDPRWWLQSWRDAGVLGA